MNLLDLLRQINGIRRAIRHNYPPKNKFGYYGRNSVIEYPITIDSPQSVYLAENACIRVGTAIINSPQEKVYIGKYTVIAPFCFLVLNNHRSTVTIPQFLLGASHINDKSSDLHIGEDVWIGGRAVILSGANLGRGCVVGANSVVNKPVPPYAVVAGSPAKIIMVKFSIDQIIKHEEKLYPPTERFSRECLENLFKEYFIGKKVFGTSDGIDENALKLLEEVKKIRKYIDWKNQE